MSSEEEAEFMKHGQGGNCEEPKNGAAQLVDTLKNWRNISENKLSSEGC